MPLIRYLGNNADRDGTGKLRLVNDEDGHERVLVLGGEPLEVSDDEVASLSGRYQIEKVEDKPEGIPHEGTNLPLDAPQTEPSFSLAPFPAEKAVDEDDEEKSEEEDEFNPSKPDSGS